MAKKELYVHVGMGKTGTTALQEFFWANREQLGQQGIHYPEAGVISGAHHLLSPHIPPFLVDLGDYLKPEQWAPQLSQVEEPRILISSELMAWAAQDLVREFCTSLQEWFDLKIVIYLRRQDSQFMAAYNQQIKAGTQKRRIDQIIPWLMSRFDYEDKIAPWEECVGALNIRVRPYERQQFFGGDIRRDFLANVLGVHNWEDFKIASGNSNPRLSLQAMEYKLQVNNLIECPELLSSFNGALLDYSRSTCENSTEIYNNQPSLSPRARQEILAQVEESNRAIAKKYLQREDGVLFLDPAPSTDKNWCAESLPVKSVCAIHEFLGSHYPELLGALRSAIQAVDDESVDGIKEAAEILGEGVMAVSDEGNPAMRRWRRMLQKSRRMAGETLRKVSAGLRR